MSTPTTHVYEVRSLKDKRGVDLISDALPFGRLWYGEPNAISYAKFRSRSHHAVIGVYDESGNVIQTHEHRGDFKEWRARSEAKGRLRGDA
ncbi:MAG TPA: hypothetical protein VFU09_01090 [Candidatus Udaeobacter sp.]|jgi:hypothetical protein|nr:hypothetical protein [Candidatus Udaeobacter sp.]